MKRKVFGNFRAARRSNSDFLTAQKIGSGTSAGSFRSSVGMNSANGPPTEPTRAASRLRSEEHTSELQSQSNLVCRLLLETKKHTTELQSQPKIACRLLLEINKELLLLPPHRY